MSAIPEKNVLENDVRPYTGDEFLEDLKDDREIWIYGERVRDVTEHPAFRNPARMMARLYNALHNEDVYPHLRTTTDTGNGGFTHPYFKVAKTREDVIAQREAIAQWARLTCGWMGRTPDYKASLMLTLGFNPGYFGDYEDNALNWYRNAQERVPFLNHALVNPPVDRDKSHEEIGDVYMHCVKETDEGIIVSGAKVVATGSALTHYNFLGQYGPIPVKDKRFAISGMLKMDTPGVKLLCRPSYSYAAEVMGSPFDNPLSSRLDENDAILVLDNALMRWEDIFIYQDLEAASTFLGTSGWAYTFAFHGCTRLAVKFDFITGLFMKALEITGTKDFRGVQVAIGEMIVWRHLFWALSDAMCGMPDDFKGVKVPNGHAGHVYRVLMTMAYPRAKELIENMVASGLIYLNSHASDFNVPELKGYLDKYLRGSYGHDAEDRVKTMRLLWDAIGTEFGGRHELYERNYSGNNENIRIEALWNAQGTGLDKQLKDFAQQCMDEYDVNGWTVGDLVNPYDVNLFMNKSAQDSDA